MAHHTEIVQSNREKLKVSFLTFQKDCDWQNLNEVILVCYCQCERPHHITQPSPLSGSPYMELQHLLPLATIKTVGDPLNVQGTLKLYEVLQRHLTGFASLKYLLTLIYKSAPIESFN